jgi:DNA-binding transcriptional LysR family regulator
LGLLPIRHKDSTAGIICPELIQMNEPIETAEMLAFAKAIESKSLSRAASELGIPRATLSRRLARLEEALGVRLLRRTTRSLTLTDAGDAFYRHARIALDAVSQAEASVRTLGSAVRGTLRVSVPPLTDPSFFAMIGDFARRFPEVRLHVHSSTQHVDLMRDGYDVAIRASTELEPGLVARTLARGALVAVASPAYLAERGTPRTRRDLAHHRCLLGFARGELPQTHWPLAGGGKLRVEGAFLSNDIALLADAAVRGLGIAVLPRLLVDRHLAAGALVQVLPAVLQGESRVSIVYPERELMPPQVRAFVEAVLAWAPGALGNAEARAMGEVAAGAARGARAKVTRKRAAAARS